MKLCLQFIRNLVNRTITLWVLTCFSVISAYASNGSQATHFLEVVEHIDATIQRHHFNPYELKNQQYQNVLKNLRTIARTSDDKETFIKEINSLWQSGPFSHVNLVASDHNAEQLAAYLDNMNVGPEATRLNWKNDIAILTINTMMGVDTISAIQKAYKEIAAKQAHGVIIDLRNNEGGAFAIRPLVSHLIDSPVHAGFFLSRQWLTMNDQLPNKQELDKQPNWQGWSIRRFWQDAEQKGLLKVTFEPQPPRLTQPVFILTSQKTASASELAVNALQESGRATIIGEPTAGKMLSQKPFDLPNGYQLFVPIADYYAMKNGRIEGNPIQPDVPVSADLALSKAIEVINSGR